MVDVDARHVLLVPFHKVTDGAWDAHMGGIDCTHYCESPYLYEPLLWAAHKGAEALL